MIVIMSLWRNDAGRDLEARADHLLSKTSAHHELRWLWITGDNDDDTHARLLGIGANHFFSHRIELISCDTGIVGEDVTTRRQRGSATASFMFGFIRKAAEYVVLHESDLLTDVDIVDRLLASNGSGPVAGWPTIEITPGHPQFYDVWAYRDLRGRQWSPRQPGRHRHRGRLVEVSSFGSVWLAPAALVRNRVITDLAICELCKQWRAEGVRLWVDPEISVEQPVQHWEG